MHLLNRKILGTACTLVLGSLLNCPAADIWFDFPLTPGTADGAPCRGELDMTALNEAPAGKHGFVKVVGEQFLDGKGNEIRWVGTNVTATALFPPKEHAAKFAAHLASVGHNIVRAHFLDNMWGGDSLLQKPDYKTWNLDALDRFHFLAAELKKRGVFLNLNIHVGRKYAGTPEGAPDFSKGLDLFYPPFIAEFRNYARFLLTSKNPYTGLTLAEDASVAVVELNNENTLLMSPWWLAELKGEQHAVLQKLWNTYLAKTYPDAKSLAAAYGVKAGDLGPELLQPFGTDAASDAAWMRDWVGDNKSSVTALADAPGGVRWEVKEKGEKQWSHQFSHRFPAGSVAKGTRLKLTWEARAEKERKLTAICMQAEAPYENMGLTESVQVGEAWKPYSLEFVMGESAGKATRITFNCNNEVGWMELRGVSLRAVPGGFLKHGESAQAGNVPLPGRGADLVVRRDFFRFLSEVENKWAVEQKAFLKELGVKVPVAHSQALFGGIMGSHREFQVSDFVDTHGYWQHPHFTKSAWDLNHWEIGNTSQLLSEDGGTLYEMAMHRPFGKPYTVSEYDIPAPHDHAAELHAMLAPVASRQGWAGVYTYCWANSLAAMDGGKIHGFFDQCGHPAKEGLQALGAFIFRKGLVPVLSKRANLHLGPERLLEDMVVSNGDVWSSWRRVWKNAAPEVRRPADLAQVGLSFADKGDAAEFSMRVGRGKSMEPEFVWSTAKETPRFHLVAPQVRIVTGKVAGEEVSLGDVKVTFAADQESAGHATLMLVSLDGQSIDSSRRIAVAGLRRAENKGMGWNAQRNSVAKAWGQGPSRVLGLNATLQIPGASCKLTPLDHLGRAKQAKATATQLSVEDATIWWLLTR